ncbi:MAG TPA: MraY family glycosyltransferase [Ktedonobacteraceae bacterium]|jgi:UDP-GlcNAc:undecaprenyl-phosphate GlcNAc-1-phosphate transferase|nr:MraY family glycosyltransferase [Ktedonobacteraceae bacterium]
MPLTSNVLTLLLAGGVTCLLTYLLTFGVIAFARKVGWVEKPVAGKIHTVTRPRIGGVGIFLAFLIVSLTFYMPLLQGEHGPTELIFGQSYPKELVIYGLFVVASLLIVAVHVYDDVRGLKPLPKLIAQTVAVLILLGPGFHVFHGVLFFGVHNPLPHTATSYNPALPWYQQPELTLFIREPLLTWLALPAALFTWFWMTGMMNAINWIDGLDGLAAGIVAIAALFVTVISWQMGQHSIAILSAIFSGSVIGFLPHNWNPARVIMGDSGSQFLGLGLAVLAVIGGAKFALLLMVMGVPILDVMIVVTNRLRRGQHPMQRDELPRYAGKTHLHYRLLFGGLNVRQVCLVLYGATFLCGFFALTLPSIFKFLGLLIVVLITVALLLWSKYLQERKQRLEQKEQTEKMA